MTTTTTTPAPANPATPAPANTFGDNAMTTPAALVITAAAILAATTDTSAAAAALAAIAPAALAPDAIDAADLAATLAAADVASNPESLATPYDYEDTALDFVAALAYLAAPVPATPAPAQNAFIAALAAHNAAPRKSYKLTAGDALAALTLDGITAYYAKTLDQWVKGFAGTPYEVESASTARKQNKRGDYIEVVVRTANYGTVHITTNSTTSVDYRRLTSSYVKKCDNRSARAANKSAGSGRRAPMSDVKRAAQAVNRYAAAAVKRLDADERKNDKLRTMITNHLSSVCVERDVDRADVIAALNDKTRAFVS